jgi:hypothetical protein
MSFSQVPSSVRTVIQVLQSILQNNNIQGTLIITATESRYEDRITPRRGHEARIHDRLPLFLSDLRRETRNAVLLVPPPGYDWEDQVAGVCNEINQFDNNTRNDERLLQYYQLGYLMSLRGFSSAARNCARSFLLPNRLHYFWQLSRRTYLLYSTRGTWNILGTINISCYALRYMAESDFLEIMMREALTARTNELMDLPF